MSIMRLVAGPARSAHDLVAVRVSYGFLGWKQSDFHTHECTDYQGVTGDALELCFPLTGN
jgi:hypothetical protein